MMNNLAVFNNNEFGEIGVIEVEDRVYFDGNKVANILGYKRPSKAISDHCKGVLTWDTLKNEGGYPIKFISEGDMYRLIIKSQLPKAEEFESWIMDEILPQIRKTGGVVQDGREEEFINNYFPSFSEDVKLSMVQDLLRTNKELKPKADNYDRLLDSRLLLSWEEVVKSANLKMGRNDFMKVLRSKKILLQSSTTPYQSYIDRDYFEVKQVLIPNGKYISQTFTTSKGLDWLVKKCGEWDLFKELANQ